MKYSTDPKKRSQLPGHRKRRRKITEVACDREQGLSWVEYKTIRQYQTLGYILDHLRVYGTPEALQDEVGCEYEDDYDISGCNGHFWLTKDLP